MSINKYHRITPALLGMALLGAYESRKPLAARAPQPPQIRAERLVAAQAKRARKNALRLARQGGAK
jgi:hypothetical protein